MDIGTGLGAMSILLALNVFSVLSGQPEEDLKGKNIAITVTQNMNIMAVHCLIGRKKPGQLV